MRFAELFEIGLRRHRRFAVPAAYPFYFAALGELERLSGNAEVARTHFRQALSQARNPMERRFYERRLEVCEVNAATSQGLEAMWDRAFEALRAFLESDQGRVDPGARGWASAPLPGRSGGQEDEIFPPSALGPDPPPT